MVTQHVMICRWMLVAVMALGLDQVRAECQMMLGPSGGWVSDARTLAVSAGSQSIRLADIPDEADLSTLALQSRYVRLDAWQRMPSNVVASRVTGLLGGEHPVLVQYQTTGLTWRAMYRVQIDQTSGALDMARLSGHIILQNQTRISFAAVQATLTGLRDDFSSIVMRGPGIIISDDDNPLADLWQKPQRELLEFAQLCPGVVNLPARQETTVPLLENEPVHVEWFWMADEDSLTGISGAARPLRQNVRIVRPERTLRRTPLPPGRATVIARDQNLRGRLVLSESSNDWNIDCGRDTRVTGARRKTSGGRDAAGYVQEVYELRLANTTDKPVRVLVKENPLSPFNWSVKKSSHKFTLQGRTLFYDETLAPRTTLIVTYQLAIEQPTI